MINKNYEEIINNFFNGNLSDFRKQVKQMNKKSLLRFMGYCKLYEFPKVIDKIYIIYDIEVS